MRTILASALALGAMTSVALAAEPAQAPAAPTGPVALTDAQMDSVTAGQLLQLRNLQVGAVIAANAAANVCALIAACGQTAVAGQEIRFEQIQIYDNNN